MTPHEIKLLSSTGYSSLVNLPGLITQWILYGISIGTISGAVLLFRKQGMKFLPFTRSLFITALCAVLASLCFALYTVVFVTYLEILLLPSQNPTALLAMTGTADRKSFFYADVLEDWITSIVIVLSDAVVIWRAWCLYPGQRWLMALPIVLILGSSATMLASNIQFSSYETWFRYVSSFAGIRVLNEAGIWLSLITNTVTTTLVGYKLWMYRKHVLPSLGRNTPSTVGRVLFRIVESGGIFCVFQLLNVITQTIIDHMPEASDSFYIGYVVISNIQLNLAAIYPVLVLAIVRSGSSIQEEYSTLQLSSIVNVAE